MKSQIWNCFCCKRYDWPQIYNVAVNFSGLGEQRFRKPGGGSKALLPNNIKNEMGNVIRNYVTTQIQTKQFSKFLFPTCSKNGRDT